MCLLIAYLLVLKLNEFYFYLFNGATTIIKERDGGNQINLIPFKGNMELQKERHVRE